VFERFTASASQVVVLAQDEARALNHNYIGTEHLLLGLLREREGVAAQALESLGLTLDDVRPRVAWIVGSGDDVATGQIPFTPRSKRVLELALREALSLSHNYIGPEHILLGLVSEGEGVASRILHDFGADGEAIRNEVARILSGGAKSREPYEPKSPPVSQEVVEEIARVISEREEALGVQAFDRAAELRDRERRLVRAARELESAWASEPSQTHAAHEAQPSELYGARGRVLLPTIGYRSQLPRRIADYEEGASFKVPFVVGWAMFAFALGIGILIGWAIWG
jgi:ATP-dependent Clp protease ATP-binding subunit ClpA